ncbi:MAG TPA: metal-dependent hydrolase [Planctomycetota bacterium]|nr:metal-dependent hydrolase [Planctomycetota bacterium]HUV39861.1 metal-dependent hydrolase [Planctomycetota bacterium]
MDTVTQVLLGTAIGEAGFRERLGWPAVLAGGVFALLPDLDIATWFAGPWTFIRHHRVESHALIVVTAAAFVAGWAAWRLAKRRGSVAAWITLAALALITHVLLDWCTSYGTTLWWPFTRTRYALDVVAIIDPLYTLPLAAALVLACIPRLSRRFSRRFAIWMLVVSTLYLVLGFTQRERARWLAIDQLERDGLEATEVRATPLPLTNLAWRVVARDRVGDLTVGFVSTAAPRRIRFHALYRPTGPLVDAALASDRGRTFAWFAGDMLSVELVKHADGAEVILRDQRFGFIRHPTRSPFAAVARFDAQGVLLDVERLTDGREVDLAAELDALWSLLWGATVNENASSETGVRR